MTAAPVSAERGPAQPKAGPRGAMPACAVAALSSSSAATPSAVPSWAAVLSAPAAVACSESATSVPIALAATEERPSPTPATATGAATSHPELTQAMSAASARPTRTSPRAITGRGAERTQRRSGRDPRRRSALRLSGISRSPAAPAERCWTRWSCEGGDGQRRAGGGGVEEGGGSAGAQSARGATPAPG